jgi:hypothetical protein
MNIFYQTLNAKRTEFEQRALSKCRQSLHLVEADPEYADPNNPTRGKCYYAAVALLHYLGSSQADYHLMRAITEDGTHYWVQDCHGFILDPTVEQFAIMKKPPPYTLGRRMVFGQAVTTRPNFKKHLPILDAMRKSDNDDD